MSAIELATLLVDGLVPYYYGFTWLVKLWYLELERRAFPILSIARIYIATFIGRVRLINVSLICLQRMWCCADQLMQVSVICVNQAHKLPYGRACECAHCARTVVLRLKVNITVLSFGGMIFANIQIQFFKVIIKS